jgi:hypothetical protein
MDYPGEHRDGECLYFCGGVLGFGVFLLVFVATGRTFFPEQDKLLYNKANLIIHLRCEAKTIKAERQLFKGGNFYQSTDICHAVEPKCLYHGVRDPSVAEKRSLQGDIK